LQPTLFTIARAGHGRLSTMARPSGGDWLDEEFRALASTGVTVVVSLLTDEEAAELELLYEADAARAAGIEFYRLPTPDREVPERSAALAIAGMLVHQLSEGASVAVHCRHGIGRSSTLAAAVMVLEGADPEDVWARISAARGLPVPDTTGQRAFIATLTPNS
jgi:protein-tyrosine phosphatase